MKRRNLYTFGLQTNRQTIQGTDSNDRNPKNKHFIVLFIIKGKQIQRIYSTFLEKNQYQGTKYDRLAHVKYRRLVSFVILLVLLFLHLDHRDGFSCPSASSFVLVVVVSSFDMVVVSSLPLSPLSLPLIINLASFASPLK